MEAVVVRNQQKEGQEISHSKGEDWATVGKEILAITKLLSSSLLGVYVKGGPLIRLDLPTSHCAGCCLPLYAVPQRHSRNDRESDGLRSGVQMVKKRSRGPGSPVVPFGAAQR